MRTGRFYSNGKLLLTGEYLVMYGAQSLAVPVKFGQSIEVKVGKKNVLKWQAFIQEKPWFEASFNINNFEVTEINDPEKASFLQKALHIAQSLNPAFLKNNIGFDVRTQLNYPQEWGLGSSSTFISNLAWWAEVDPMELFRILSDGSGYDVACARAQKPIIFEKPKWLEVNFHPNFSDHIYFLYLGNKQDSAKSVKAFKKNYIFSENDIAYISELTNKLLTSDNLSDTIEIIADHERFLSKLLGIKPVKEQLFPDFNGAIKSLGAWGGDFVMVASHLHFLEVNSYFRNKGLNTLFKYEELILNGTTDSSSTN